MRPSSAEHAKIATVTWPHIAISLRPEKKTALVGPLGLDPQKVVSFGSVSAALNHVGPFLGIAPTGREVEFRFAVFVTFRDGLIAGEKFYYDLAGILRQIGALDFV